MMFLQRNTITIFGLLTASFILGTPVEDCQHRSPLNQAYHLADDEDCTVFYRCTHTSPVKFVCPEGLHFNRELEVCDWPEDAGCSDPEYSASAADETRPSAALRSTLKQPPELCPAPAACPLFVAKHVPHAFNCSKFCKCNNGQPVMIDCPSGLHFNPALEVCDWPERAGCSVIAASPTEVHPSTAIPSTSTSDDTFTTEYITTTETYTSDPSTPDEFPTTTSDNEIMLGDCPAVGTCPQYEDEKSVVKHLPHASNCSQFCRCDHGVPIKFDCPAGLHFNPILEVCDWPQNSDCSSMFSAGLSDIQSTGYTTFETDTTFTEPASTSIEPLTDVPSFTSELSNEHTYEFDISTEDTNTDVILTTGLTTEATSTSLKSPTNFPTHTTEAFTTDTDVTTTVTDETTVVTESTSLEETCAIIRSCPDYDQQSVVKHLPHPTNCSLYCRCNHGVAITEICPTGLHFNAELEVCDWPSNATCK